MFRADQPEGATPKIGLAVLVGLAFVVRAVWGLARPGELGALPDQWEYMELARSLLAGDGLAFVDERFGDVVRAYRMPGYPLFLAAVGANAVLARLVQAALDASVVAAAVLLARRLGCGRWAVIAGLFVAFSPFAVYFSGLLLTETLFTFLLAWGVALLAGVGGRRWGWWAGVGLLVASVYVKPSAALLPALLGGWAVVLHQRHPFAHRGRWPLPPVATAALLTFLALLPWAARNRFVVGQWIFTTTNGGVTLYDGLNGDADGSSDQSVLEQLPQLSRMTETQRADYLAGRAVEFAREHPDRVAELAAAKVGRTWSPWPLSAEYGSRLNQVAGAVYSLPLFALAAAGVLFGRIRRRAKVFLLLPAIYFTLGHAVTIGSLRYRVPAEPMLAVLAAAGAGAVLERRAAGGRSRWLPADANLTADDVPRHDPT